MARNKYKNYTYLDAIFALGHPRFLMSMPHNGNLTEAEYNASYKEITGKTEDGTAITSNDVNDFTVSYAEAKAKYEELKAQQDLDNVRIERNALLEESDWTVQPDAPFSAEKIEEWKTYRQTLRDIPTSCTSLDDVVWPDKP